MYVTNDIYRLTFVNAVANKEMSIVSYEALDLAIRPPPPPSPPPQELSMVDYFILV